MIDDIDESQAPLLDHLLELRTRLLRCVYALVAAFVVCFYFADDIFSILARPLVVAFPPGEGRLIYTKLYEAFFVETESGDVCCVFHQFSGDCQPALGVCRTGALCASEKRAFLPFLILATPVLFTMRRKPWPTMW
jgi:sec-independent protein translocase protein TatC